MGTTYSHEDSGMRCLVYHGPDKPQCVQCRHCRQWIQRDHMDDDCPELLKQLETERQRADAEGKFSRYYGPNEWD
jgi:hypothetical protein